MRSEQDWAGTLLENQKEESIFRNKPAALAEFVRVRSYMLKETKTYCEIEVAMLQTGYVVQMCSLSCLYLAGSQNLTFASASDVERFRVVLLSFSLCDAPYSAKVRK